MNERIKELTFSVGAKLYSEPPMRQVTGVSMTFEQMEKFAELIVRECSSVVFKNTGPRSALYVLEHFGLKDEE